MSLPRQTTVLICGAGPAGMAAALSLHHHKIHDVVIVDSLLAGQNSSRAMVIQAATLEALDTVGCLENLLEAGTKVERLGLHNGSSYLISADFSLLSSYTKFPFGLTIPQSSTEAGMLEKMAEAGINVLRPFKAVSMKASPDREGTIDVAFDSGDIVQAKYVIGADGAHSVIRNEVGIAFKDPDGDEGRDYGNLSQLALGDVAFSSPPQFPAPATNVFVSMADGNFTLLVPFPAHASPDKTRTVYRFASSVPVEDGTAPHAPGTDYLQSLLDRCGAASLSSDPTVNPHPTRIERTYWSSRYRTRAAIADRCFTRLAGSGAVLLIGDAAHIHSPLGGQGMSLGIRDAISLGTALKAHIALDADKSGSDKLLEDWAADRHARALSVIALTKRGLRVISSRNAWLPFRLLGLAVLWLAFRFTFFKRMIAYRISGLADV
ncbi:FAD/NAD-P-binding domain-containing protein [Mycena crocata]|nr:FAD/NAD-P-binding domain-containing protein [Mycena crocata]